MTEVELHWTAGFLEGEGSFSMPGTSPRVDCAQVQAQPVERLHKYFKGTLTKRWPGKTRGWQEQNYWYCNGPRAIGVMMTMYPLLSPRRQGQIRDVIERWKKKPARAGKQTRSTKLQSV